MDKRRPRVPASPEQRRPRLHAVEDQEPEHTEPHPAGLTPTSPRQQTRPSQRAARGEHSTVRTAAGAARTTPESARTAPETTRTTPGAGADGSAGRSWKAQRETTRKDRVQRFWHFVEEGNPYTTFWLLLGSALALTIFGLVMVLSATAVEAVGTPDGAYGVFMRQAMWAGIGLVGMFSVAFMPRGWLKKLAWPAMVLAIIGLALVLTPLGYEVQGNRNWIRIGPLNGQPSELAKLALCLWTGLVLARKGHKVRELQHTIVPVLMPGAALVFAFIMWGRDLGTALIFGFFLAAMLFVSGTKARYFLVAGATGIIGAVALALMSPNRTVRIQAWLGLNDACSLPQDFCYQSEQGLYALASGGFWGVGLGQSRQKWNYIPEAENDFIFTILGEELGLLGALTVLLLFATLALGMFRVASRSTETWVKITTVGIMAWVIGQTFINLAMVTGLLPVIGVPLPFISAGGSALTSNLVAVGVVMNFAQAQRVDARSRAGTRPSKPTGRNQAGKKTGKKAGMTSRRKPATV
ncbi:FtsW/RodA/SpoVE family cell cycle protein [Nesterenkonia sandarakina]|uniref:Probable peptidoglycan glycosyltransferase FtsW n=1 Tax=Nesterenkonia sandarakina TaxID=272918 RepID=A0A7Z0E926_9MICC|nr:putative peptidoglycan glycosyltransferase FtsW [Nesterenkonia sandarakina]NYJ17310.1 cell division protein FtsW [Nesterenkonia sandarakina]